MQSVVDFLLKSPLIEAMSQNMPCGFAIGINGVPQMWNDKFEKLIINDKNDTKPISTSAGMAGRFIGPWEDLFINDNYDILKREFIFEGSRISLCLAIQQNASKTAACPPFLQCEADAFKKALLWLAMERLGESFQIEQGLDRALEFTSLNVNFVIYCKNPSVAEFLGSLIARLSRPAPLKKIDLAEVAECEREKLFSDLDLATPHVLLIQNIQLLSSHMQKRLADILSKEASRNTGHDKAQPLQVIATAPSDLLPDVKLGKFSRELFLSLQNVTLEIPDQAGASGLSAEARLSKPISPGSKAELIFANMLGRIAVLQDRLANSPSKNEAAKMPDSDEDLNMERWLEAAERECIKRALARTGNRKDKAAELVGMNLRTFHRRCAKLGL